jgi:prolyl 4-hydroxylase
MASVPKKCVTKQKMGDAMFFAAGAVAIANLMVFAIILSSGNNDRESFANQPSKEDSSDAIAYDVVRIPDVLTPQECDRLVAFAKSADMSSSKVWTGDTSSPDVQSMHRTSRQVWINYDDSEVGDIARKLRRKAAQLTGVFDPAAFEKIQLARYDVRGEYQQHFDSCTTNCPSNRLCRIATLLVYLNDTDGGNTVFPKMGISIRPQKGAASFFYNVDTRDPDYPELHAAMHAGSPVVSGEKFIANVWVACPNATHV